LTNTSTEARELESFFGDESERADTEAFLVGSALRVLSASRSSARRFNHFTLIDADKPSCTELESVVDSDFPETKDRVNVLCEDANAALDEYIGSMDWGNTRALVFLDPYGLEVRWDTIMRLAGTGACDVWYLFPLGGVIRMMTNDGQIPDTWQARLDQLFGTHDWYHEFYSTARQKSLFGEGHDLMYKDASTQHVVTYVRERLLTAFPAVSKAGIFRNRKGAPLFALLLGVSNPRRPAQNAALRIGNHLVKDLTEL
jgi:three-Cys-motif partner protein